MMYLLTEQEHAQIVDALEYSTAIAEFDDMQSEQSAREKHSKALAMLKAMEPLEPVGYWDTIDGADLTYSVGELMGGSTYGLKPLYAKEQQ